MEKNVMLVPYVLLMVAIIVAADLLFFRHKFLGRLIANTTIVLLFALFYFVFLKR